MPDLLTIAGEGIADLFTSGAAEAGIASTADAAVGAGALDAGASAAIDAGVGATADAALSAGSLGLGAGATAGAADATLGAAGADAALGGAGALGGTGVAGDAATLLPEQTVTAASLAPGAAAGAGTGLSAPGLSAVLGGTALAAAGAGGGGSGVPGTASTPASSSQAADLSNATADTSVPGVTDIGQTLSGTQFLSADDTAPSLQALANPSQFGIDTGASMATSDFDLANATVNPADTGIGDTAAGGASGGGNSLMSWLTNPKNAATAGLLGLSLKSALTRPNLPSSLSTANAAATSAVQNATPIIQSGGTATPEWTSQKASIDATINQQIQQQTEAILQAAASSGEGNANSGIVQQQVQTMTANLNVQRQQLYLQAQQQNVSAALSELSGGDQVLTSIGATQLQQSEEAQALAAQTAELALMLGSGTGTVKLPGVGAGG